MIEPSPIYKRDLYDDIVPHEDIKCRATHHFYEG